MKRLTLRFGTQTRTMPTGESYVGRGLDCQLRFNDAAVSRRHLRLICRAEGSYIENLSMTNGSLLNSEPLVESRQLFEGDVIQLGRQLLRVQLEDERKGEINTESGSGAASVSEDDWGAGEATEQTMPGFEPGSAFFGSAPEARNCPQCLEMVAFEDSRCGRCGHTWERGHAVPTEEIDLPCVVRREFARKYVEIPALYSSEHLTLDAYIRDISLGGMFIVTEILDPVETPCEVTVLPDGEAPIFFQGQVCHVSTLRVGNRPPGFGIRFSEMPESAQEWLKRVAGKSVSH